MTTNEIVDDINKESMQRFSSAPWFERARNLRISIIGLGGIGSYAAYALSRFRPLGITLVDLDTVETVNLAGQMYKMSDVGLFKTESICKSLIEFSHCYANTHSARIQDIDGVIESYDIVVCGFDNMEARQEVWRRFKNSSDPKLLIDGRMNAEFYQLLCVNKQDLNSMIRYEKNWLFPSSEAEQTVCSFKQTSFMGMQIGGMIGSLVANYVNNLCNNTVTRPVPFLTEFNSASMYLNVEE